MYLAVIYQKYIMCVCSCECMGLYIWDADIYAEDDGLLINLWIENLQCSLLFIDGRVYT